MKSVKQMLIDKEISEYDACKKYYNELTQEDVDYIAEKETWYAAKYLDKHPFLTKEHFDIIVELTPSYAAHYLNQHPFFTQKHVDYITENEPSYAIKFLSHYLSEENIVWIAENHSEYLKKVFK